jgi:hypothetical protein
MKKLAILISFLAVLAAAGPASADSLDIWRWDGTHAIKTWVWAGNFWCLPRGDGTADCGFTVHLRVKNIDTRKVAGSCLVKGYVKLGGSTYYHKKTLSFAVRPGRTHGRGFDVSYYKPANTTMSQDFWAASCSA